MGFGNFKKCYENHPVMNILGNSVAILLGGKVFSGLAEKVFDAAGLSAAIDLASSLTAGMYLLYRTEGIKSEITKRAAQLGAITLTGGLVGSELGNLTENVEWAYQLKNVYQNICQYLSKISGSEGNFVNGSLLGFITSLAYLHGKKSEEKKE